MVILCFRFHDKASLKQAIANVEFRGGPTDAYTAITRTGEYVLRPENGNRASARVLIVMITDGYPNINANLAIGAKNKWFQGMQVIAVGINKKQVNESYLIALSSDGLEGSTWFLTPNFERLNDILDGVGT